MTVERIIFKKTKDVDLLLLNYPEIYSVESLVWSRLNYGISDGWFALITPYYMMRVRYSELLEFAEKLKQDIKEEVLSIYEDTKFLFEGSDGKWLTKSVMQLKQNTEMA